MRTLTFKKEDEDWFIDLKWWIFGKHHLAMVAGADTLLDKLAEGKDIVKLEISTKLYDKFSNYPKKIIRVEKIDGWFSGAIYESPSIEFTTDNLLPNNHLWLCFVTLFVFGKYPKKIFFNKIEIN